MVIVLTNINNRLKNGDETGVYIISNTPPQLSTHNESNLEINENSPKTNESGPY
jgi:hypothetical protein